MDLKKTIISSFWICLLFVACYEDKGNYDLIDYNKIESVTASSLSDYTITLGDTLKIYPLIKWKYPERDTLNGFEYVWKTTWYGDTLSRERDLEIVPEECGQYNCYLFIKEKATGVIFRASFSVSVDTPYALGWIIASNINGKPTISYIRRDSWQDDDKKTHYYWTDYVDLYTNLHPEKPLEGGKIVNVSSYTVDYYDDELMIFQEGGKVSVLNGLDFGKILNLNDEFPSSSYPQGFIAKDFIRGGYCDFVLGEAGEIYWRRNSRSSQMYHEEIFMDVPVYFPGGGAVISQIFDINVDDANFILMYDDKFKRFLACYTSYSSGNSYLGGKMDIINNYPTSEFANILDLSDYELMYCGDHTDGKSFVNILKDKASGKYLYQSYRLTGSMTSLTVTNASQEVFAGSDLITDNSVFWRLRQSSYLYFSSGSKLYFYDVNTKRVKLYTDFEEGKIVKLMEDAEGLKLGVGLDNGTFVLCEASDPDVLGAIDPGEKGILHQVSGLGEIVDIDWKWGGYYNMVFGSY